MNQPLEKSESRRQFLLAGGRLLALGGLASYAAGQEIKRRRLLTDPNCVKLYGCEQCVELGGCTRPKAERFRLSRERASSGSQS